MLQAFAGTFQSFFRAYERLEYTALVVLAERGITIGVTFALLALGYGLLEIAVTFLVGGGLSLALSIALVRRKFTWFSHTFDRRTASSVLRRAVPFALGAVISTIILSTGPVLLTILRPSAGVILAGSAAGIVGALALAPLLSSLLHGVDPSDRSMLAMAPAVLMSIGILAAVLASARVLWVAPAETLRTE